MAIEVTTPPSVEPLSTAEAKAQIRVDLDVEDALIDAAVIAARSWVEANSNLKLITQTVKLTQTGFCGWGVPLPVAPVQSITSVEYKSPATGDLVTLDPAEYQLVKSALPFHVAPAYGKTWPTVRADFDSVVITMVAGFGDAGSDVPGDLLAAIRLMVAHFYENRQNEQAGTVVSKLSIGADRLMTPHKLHN